MKEKRFGSTESNPSSVGREEWKELIGKASQYGLTPGQLNTIIDLQWQIFKEILGTSRPSPHLDISSGHSCGIAFGKPYGK